MGRLSKWPERGLVGFAKVLWPVFQSFNRFFPAKPFHPSWAPAPLLKSWERSRPQLGFPRETDSLCPKCVVEVREKIISGEVELKSLLDAHPGEIRARIVERDGQVFMEKNCPKHGFYSDLMAVDAKFLKRMEDLYPGRDFKAIPSGIRSHGTSSIKYGRGAVLSVDLTNRCNMMCDPCFMDANQVGYVHELTFADIKEILDNSVQIKPKRQMTIQFAGGEPTISPFFLDAVRYARDIGYKSVQAATNGIKFAQDPQFAKDAYEAGMRIAYLQFDGVGNLAHEHRKISNLFDVKARAIENLYEAGIDVCLVTTVVKTINDDQVGAIVRFAMENCDKISSVSFQPVSFTGRDEGIEPALREARRYTLSHLAHDIKTQLGMTEPLRDWFPLSAISPISDLADLIKGPGADWGTLKCGCHPNCGIGTAFMINKRTKAVKPFCEFFDTEQFFKDCTTITDAARGKVATAVQTALALLRNYNPGGVPDGLTLKALMQKLDKQSSANVLGDYGVGKERKKDEWLFLMVAGMWFQDLFNYDFRRTEQCIIPHGTQMGEISFCAYNTGVGWRQILENLKKNASVAQWNRAHGRAPVYANHTPIRVEDDQRPVPLVVNGKTYALEHVEQDHKQAIYEKTYKPIVNDSHKHIDEEDQSENLPVVRAG